MHTRSKKRQPEYELVEYSDLTILVPHRIERNVKNMQITLVCSLCGDKYTETYARQHPDQLAHRLNCPSCYTHTYKLVQVVPSTVHYRSSAMERASFSDDISGECFECGKAEALHSYTFSNGMQVRLCTAHYHRYLKIAFKLSEQQEELVSSDERMEYAEMLWQEQVEVDRNNSSMWGY
jgi:hypothetical protein